MSLNLIKLCVGVSEIAELRHWQQRRLKENKAVFHVTRMVPRRKVELLDGGSLFWVMRGIITCRQRITDIEEFTDTEGIKRCRLIFDPELVPVVPSPRRAFQGWRYLEPDKAPADIDMRSGDADMPAEMRAQLAELGLI